MKKAILGILILAIIAAALFWFVFPNTKNDAAKLLYPQKYSSIVEKEAKKNNLDTALVYAVIKTESGFDVDAASGVGAKGLMQLTDDTFLWLQMRLGEEHEIEELFTPEINIKYGCAFLEILLRNYATTDVALAAYNAGIGSVDSWLSNPEYSNDGKTLAHIPYEETGTYVERVNTSLKNYKELY